MKKYTVWFLAVLICVFTVMQGTLVAQESDSARWQRQRQERELEKARGIVERDLGRLELVGRNYYNNSNSFDPYVPPFQSFEFFGPYKVSAGFPLSAIGRWSKNTSEIEERLNIEDEEISAYQTFLSFPKTGVFKLLSYKNCTTETDKEKCYDLNRSVKFFGSSYSFREKEHKLFYQSDLIKFGDSLETSQNANQSVFVNLGDVSLENLTLNSEGMNFLVNFVPERKAEKVNEQYEKIAKGIKIGNYEYLKSLPIAENNTYALRSVAYKGSLYSPGEIADVIVAFRVIDADKDGTLTVVWKEMSRKDGVKLK